MEGYYSTGSSKRLPQSEQVNVSALSRVFGKTTNSYKFLFFISLLDILKRRRFDVEKPISFQELIIEMLANAWFPHTFFKLSFGSQDKISQKLDSLDLAIGRPIIQFKDIDKKLLRSTIAAQDLSDVVSHLSRYVPFRLIVPFLEKELKGVDRGRGNKLEKAMPAVADRCFESQKPLYRIDSTEYKDSQAIIVHPDWAFYLEHHYGVVRGWASWEWLKYMQKRNPSTPAIGNKLFMPSKRDSLDKQTQYWKLAIAKQPINCIYSNQPINPSQFSLDHYLPWSFVTHDLLWNLIPVPPKINSAKSNNLAASRYLDEFIKLQHQGLRITQRSMPDEKWTKTIESYLSGLKISNKNDLLDLEKLSNAYKRELEPLMSLAINQGFKSDWNYENKL